MYCVNYIKPDGRLYYSYVDAIDTADARKIAQAQHNIKKVEKIHLCADPSYIHPKEMLR